MSVSDLLLRMYLHGQAPVTPPVSGAAVVSGTFADSTPFSVALMPGQRLPLVAGTIQRGSAIFHSDGKSVCIENAYMGVLNDLYGSFSVVVDGVSLFSGMLRIWCYSRTRPFWAATPTVLPSPDLSPFPTYGTGSGSASMYSTYMAANNSPMSPGMAALAMDATGEAINLGPLPQWDSDYIVNPSANNAIVVRGMADAAAVWRYHVIDPATNAMVDMSSNPYITFSKDYIGTGGNPIVNFTSTISSSGMALTVGQSHAPAWCALSNAVYGTEYDKEELAFWANFNGSLWANPAYRESNGCSVLHTQTRGIGRNLTIQLYAKTYCNNPTYFDAWIKTIASVVTPKFTAQTGIHIDQGGQSAGAYMYDGYSPFMMYVLNYAFGQAMDFGYTEFQTLHDYCAVNTLDSVLKTQHELATMYSISWRHDNGSTPPNGMGTICTDWVDGINTNAARLAAGGPSYAQPTTTSQPNLPSNKLVNALAAAENSSALIAAIDPTGASYYIPGDFVGYPTSPTGYPIQLKMALSQIKRHGTDTVRADAAWTVLKAHIRADCSSNPKYNLEP